VDNRFQLAIEEARKVDKFIESGEKDVATIATETPFLGVPFTIKGELEKENSILIGLINIMYFIRLLFSSRATIHRRFSEA